MTAGAGSTSFPGGEDATAPEEFTPAFDTQPIRGQMESWPGIGKFLATMERDMRLSVAEMAMTEDIPIQMVMAVAKLAENSVSIREQLFGLHSNFTRWLDVVDGKQVAGQAGGADGLG